MHVVSSPPPPPSTPHTHQVLPSARNRFAVETILRAATTEMGSKSGVAGAPLPRKILAAYGVPHSVSQAWRIGRAVALARRRNDLAGVPRAILALQEGACLFVGKIVDVRRVSTGLSSATEEIADGDWLCGTGSPPRLYVG